MKSKYIDFRNEQNYEELKAPAEAIKQGKLVLFPTETVYGIGANGLDEKAVKSIFTLLRKVDAYNVDLVIIEGVEPTGLGLAIMNRLIRSCSHNYQEL